MRSSRRTWPRRRCPEPARRERAGRVGRACSGVPGRRGRARPRRGRALRLATGGDAVIARIEPASPELLAEIERWAYEPPYDFYDGRHEPVRNPERFFAAHDENGS